MFHPLDLGDPKSNALLPLESTPTYEMDDDSVWDEDEDDYDPFDYVALHCDRLGYHETALHLPSANTTIPSVRTAEPLMLPLPDIFTTPMLPWSERRKDEPYLILPGLYLGSESHAKHEYMLSRLGVTHVLGIHENAKRHFPQAFDYCLFPLKDRQETDISLVFKDAHSYIRKAHDNNGVVFVHCWAGMSRSATLVITYLMQLEKISYNEAYKRVASAKPDIRPNEGFIYQMKQFEKTLGLHTETKSAKRKTDRSSDQERKPNAFLAWSQPATPSGSTFSKSPKAIRGGRRRAGRS